MSAFDFRKMTSNDLIQISEIHQLAFDKTHFTSNFSIKMLTKFYTELLSMNDNCAVGVDGDNKIVGFIVSGYKTGIAIKSFTNKNRLSLITTLLIHPAFIVEKLYAIINKLFKKNDYGSTAKLRLLSIAIHPEVQGKGVANDLVHYYENSLLQQGIDTYGLSVKKENQRAVSFYRKTAFEVEYETKDALYFLKKLK